MSLVSVSVSVSSMGFYLVAFAGDAVDGHVARAFNQGTHLCVSFFTDSRDKLAALCNIYFRCTARYSSKLY